MIYPRSPEKKADGTDKMKAISKFKSLLTPKGAVSKPNEPISEGLDGAEREGKSTDSRSPNTGEPWSGVSNDEKAKMAAENVARIIKERERFLKGSPSGPQKLVGEKGHAHDPTDEEPPFLGIGTGEQDAFASGDIPTADVMSDSPTAVHFNVYDRAFEEEVNKIKRSTSRKGRQGTSTTLYLTKHVRDEKKFRTMEDPDITWVGDDDEDELDNSKGKSTAASASRSGVSFADLVHGAVNDAKSKAQTIVGVSQYESKPDSTDAER